MRFLDFHSETVSTNAALVATTIALVLFTMRRFIHCRKAKQHVVGGTVLNQLFNFHRLHDYMTDLARKHKTYRLLSFSRSEVYTADPVIVEYILRTNFINYGKDLFFKSTLDSVFNIVLGVELDTMCGTYEEGTKFSRALDEASELISLNIGLEAELKKHVRVIDE